MTAKTDCELVNAYISGGEWAVEVLLRRHRTRVYSYIYKRVNDIELAEDLFQDVFIKVILTLKEGKYSEEGKFLPWVLRIAHNLIVDYFRLNNKTKIIGETDSYNEDYNIFDFVQLSDLSIEDTIIREQKITDLNKLITFLPADQREVLELRFFKGLSFKEISEETQVGINTALGRMRYALINLRKMIESRNIAFAD
ncbi:MAG: sigma-70 family RNA polymerase sigma factor [Flavobacteriaceae bacterium]|jgi:RNA polymerase sigma-70 factor (ECF subfamily)|nr:sigma-70 family RNA polymerase sigma factor [Flavobacteriaceae bacterium]